jgi:dTDP-4-amino-4,6-dideoxygalactose transaminase
MIPFNRPAIVGTEVSNIRIAVANQKLSGDGDFTNKCHSWFKAKLNRKGVLLTTSCTHALEMCAILLDIKSGDEVIMPSYTFVSTANAFVLRGAKIVFVDIRPDTLNIDETKIEGAITDKTRLIVPVHYAGVSCEMDEIMKIADKYNLYVVEDAAQGVMSSYKDSPLGTIGHFGVYSFHETKNYTSGGEGGLLIVNDESFLESAEIIREKGTNRSNFLRGFVDKYSWISVGSSYLPSEINAAFLYSQLLSANAINMQRLSSWKYYFNNLLNVKEIDLPIIPSECSHNAHMFYIKVKDLRVRSELIKYLNIKGVSAFFHYVPLHSSKAGIKHGTFHLEDVYTTLESERIVRLPMFYELQKHEQEVVVDSIKSFFKLINA